MMEDELLVTGRSVKSAVVWTKDPRRHNNLHPGSPLLLAWTLKDSVASIASFTFSTAAQMKLSPVHLSMYTRMEYTCRPNAYLLFL